MIREYLMLAVLTANAVYGLYCYHKGELDKAVYFMVWVLIILVGRVLLLGFDLWKDLDTVIKMMSGLILL